MKKKYVVTGMTCQNCVSSVQKSLSSLDGVTKVVVDLASEEVEITMETPLELSDIQAALPDKYSIEPITEKHVNKDVLVPEPTPKWKQLWPLLLVFLYIIGGVCLMHYKDWNPQEAMLDFMGLFFIVFSFFKFLDLQGFASSFRMYDPLAKMLPFYGWVYPFIELALGIMFLLRIEVRYALIVTILVLGITTIGVTKTLLDKKSIRCACLGTALNLPMTEATFIENSIMLVMAITTLLQMS